MSYFFLFFCIMFAACGTAALFINFVEWPDDKRFLPVAVACFILSIASGLVAIQ